MAKRKMPAGFSDVMRRTGASRGQLIYWSRYLPCQLVGTGHSRTYSEEEIRKVHHAVIACRLWGGSAWRRIIVDGGRLPSGLTDQEWMALYELRRGQDTEATQAATR